VLQLGPDGAFDWERLPTPNDGEPFPEDYEWN
jgi:hypothetical protein